ncbi:MAG: hypothetical protein FWD43_02670 [Coriobacteriia bacterium]|nr:hypothetical protein [Coriobacteriia bacterium]
MLEIITSLVFCVLIPCIVMGLLIRPLRASAPKIPNYRGTKVFQGLGIIWLIWLLFFWVGAYLVVLLRFEQPIWVSYFIPLFPLVAGTCAFGLFDDLAGDKEVKGFRGHLRALAKGRLTTGGLKMLGIGLLSLFTAVSLYWTGVSSWPRILLVTCVIALMANSINLFDARPGRAGKVYFDCLILAVLGIIFGGVLHLNAVTIVAIVLAGLGPLVAVWRFDIGEKGILGDAGANSMGVFLGYLLATSLPLLALAILTVVLLALNILGEFVSFSRIIERNRVLNALDRLGRKDINR